MKSNIQKMTLVLAIISLLSGVSYASTSLENLVSNTQNWKLGTSRIDKAGYSQNGNACELSYKQGKLLVSTMSKENQEEAFIEIKISNPRSSQSESHSRESYQIEENINTPCPSHTQMKSIVYIEYDLKYRSVFISRDYTCPSLGKLPQYRQSIQCIWK